MYFDEKQNDKPVLVVAGTAFCQYGRDQLLSNPVEWQIAAGQDDSLLPNSTDLISRNEVHQKFKNPVVYSLYFECLLDDAETCEPSVPILAVDHGRDTGLEKPIEFSWLHSMYFFTLGFREKDWKRHNLTA